MNQKLMRHIGAAVGIIIGAIFCTLFFKNILIGIGIVIGGIFTYGSLDAITYQCKLLTFGLFANIGLKGRSSIVPGDKFDLKSPYDDKKYNLGGSSVTLIPFHGFGPVFIALDGIPREEEGEIQINAHWDKVTFDMLPDQWQTTIKDRVVHFS